MVNKIMKHFLSITDLTAQEIMNILFFSKQLKEKLIGSGESPQILKNKTMVMIFEKPSLRTRASFEIGMTQFGGHTIYLGVNDIGLGIRETIHDSSKVLSSMGNIIMARTFKHETIIELAKWSKVPVINGLSNLEHPCQILADLLTILEIKKSFKNLKIAFIGDGNNNVTHSLCLAAAILGINFSVSSPKGYFMKKEILKNAKKIAKNTGAKIIETETPKEAALNADVIYTDTWVSMGNEVEKEKRLKAFKSFQINKSIMSFAKKDAIFMHDMPAYRNIEVTSEVIDGEQSVIFQQAENRLHAQKGLLYVMAKKI